MGVPRGTTPTLSLTFNDESLDLTEANSVYVTLSAGGKTITKQDEDLEIQAKQIDVYLAQDETLAFPEGRVKIQANWVYSDASRGASDIACFEFTPQLLGSVLP